MSVSEGTGRGTHKVAHRPHLCKLASTSSSITTCRRIRYACSRTPSARRVSSLRVTLPTSTARNRCSFGAASISEGLAQGRSLQPVGLERDSLEALTRCPRRTFRSRPITRSLYSVTMAVTTTANSNRTLGVPLVPSRCLQRKGSSCRPLRRARWQWRHPRRNPDQRPSPPLPHSTSLPTQFFAL